MKSVLVTGAYGFIGKNLCSQLELMDDVTIMKYGSSDTPEQLEVYIKSADFIYHLAGVNRTENEEDFATGNKNLTTTIVDTLRENSLKTPLLITSSTQAELDNAYGESKRAAEDAVFKWHSESGTRVYVYRLPGIFGKWCKPNYNSVVATFCYNIANKQPISISDPSHQVTLAYIDDVIDKFTSHLQSSADDNTGQYQTINRTFTVALGELADRIEAIHDMRSSLIVPDLSDLLNKFLYATYISYLDTDNFSYNLQKNSDERGWLAEFIKSRQFGQVFVSKTKPGISRGDHWHKTKIEKFLVVDGDAKIIFRNKTNNQDIISYTISGDEMKIVDIPVGYVHAITNVGNKDLITLFWANEILDKENPDTFYEKVELE